MVAGLDEIAEAADEGRDTVHKSEAQVDKAQEDDGSLFKMPMAKQPATIPKPRPKGLPDLRHQSNMDQLADQIKQRFQDINKNKFTADDSDSNPSSDDSESDD